MCKSDEKHLCPEHYFRLIFLLLLKLNDKPEKTFIQDDIFTPNILETMLRTTKNVISHFTEKEEI